MKIRWTRTALADLQSLRAYIAADNPAAADDMMDRLSDGVEHLRNNPDMGRRGRVAGTRELVMPPYIIAYRTRGDEIAIIAVIHGARKWPDQL